ncbi:hypothetical protein EG349_10220 [Chryseobacterium shandongense]|uniref:Uncharacterized protein n=1 Tax=Chryseobacterium shandongense TaxID=1493872 RepID=A0AAD0YE85_9FLAO|nr:hypothetical protein EG349_10220 [Chryseobacterium shandongense]AZA95563.1 hypothetical protein EG353_08295 [Chryseobacterium shandongense]
MCNKIGFASKKEANTTKNFIRRTSSRAVLPERTYFCRECGKWVLTSKKIFNKNEHIRQKLSGNQRKNRRGRFKGDD